MAWDPEQGSLASAMLLLGAALFFGYCLLHLLRVDRLPQDHRPVTPVRPPQDRRSATERDIRYLERLADEQDEEPVPFAVSDVVVDTVLARRAAGLRVEVFTGDDAVMGAPEDLAIVLDSLLSNAQIHGHGRGVRVESGRTDGFVEIVVRDHGPGVLEPARRLLFDPAGGDSTQSGSGLGLHICRNLMRHHGGDLLLRETSQGAAFVARIPVQRRP